MHVLRGKRLRSSVLVAVAAGSLGFLYLFDPASANMYLTCPFLAITGCYCPGCGTLRGLHQLTHGHPVAALDLNPLMMLSLPFVGYFLASHAMLAVAGRPLRTFFVRPALIWALLGAVLVYWLLRNIPAYPFTLLAP